MNLQYNRRIEIQIICSTFRTVLEFWYSKREFQQKENKFFYYNISFGATTIVTKTHGNMHHSKMSFSNVDPYILIQKKV